MKSIMLALALAGLSQFAAGAAKAEVHYPWCAWYDDYTYNCGFTSLGQCRANISGMGGVCRENMMPAPVYSAPVAASPVAAAPRSQPQQKRR